MLRIVFFVVYVAIKSGVTGLRTAMRFVGLRSLEGRLSDTWTTRQRPEPTIAHGDDFHRGFVLDGADDDDAEDEDWDPNSHEQDSEGGSDDEDEDERDFDEDENALALISDLSTSLEEEHRLTPTELAPYLVAHQLSASRSLLTRRQYNAIFPAANVDGAASSPSSSIDQLESAITGSLRSNDRLLKMTREERESKRQEWRESRSQFCVVCTVEPRTVILWPCRESCFSFSSASLVLNQQRTLSLKAAWRCARVVEMRSHSGRPHRHLEAATVLGILVLERVATSVQPVVLPSRATPRLCVSPSFSSD